MTEPTDRTTVSICQDLALTYPGSKDFFAPDQSLPEYKWRHLASEPNGVYVAVRNCLANAGLDESNFGTPAWNPLRRYIAPGQDVFLLCNFVKHNDLRAPENVFSAKCTHASVLRPLIDYVLLALGSQGSVHFGNAPLQSCDWSKVVAETGARRLEEFYASHSQGGPQVNLVDLRGHVVTRGLLGGLRTTRHNDEQDVSARIDLGRDSLLEAHYKAGSSPRYRVQDYDPRLTENCHSRGRHVYLVNQHLLRSDVIISVPKLKTHEKVGMTCGLKGCVGSVAYKDCLAHHRYGAPASGGDEYPDRLRFLKVMSAIHEEANRGNGLTQKLIQPIDLFSRKIVRQFTRSIGGAWSGNDTCWRMALDLARILEYADKDGNLCNSKQRRHLLFTDGIIAGEGNGPMDPKPVPLGYLAFSENIVMGDYANCLAMGYDPGQLPLVHQAFSLSKYPLCDLPRSRFSACLNGRTLGASDLAGAFNRTFVPPKGWRDLLVTN